MYCLGTTQKVACKYVGESVIHARAHVLTPLLYVRNVWADRAQSWYVATGPKDTRLTQACLCVTEHAHPACVSGMVGPIELKVRVSIETGCIGGSFTLIMVCYPTYAECANAAHSCPSWMAGIHCSQIFPDVNERSNPLQPFSVSAHVTLLRVRFDLVDCF